MPAIPWIISAIVIAIITAFTQVGREIVENVYYLILYWGLLLLNSLFSFYKDVIQLIFNKMVMVLPDSISMFILELKLFDILLLYATIAFLRKRLGF